MFKVINSIINKFKDDVYLDIHSKNVAVFAGSLYEKLEYYNYRIDFSRNDLYVNAVLHDFGKLYISDEILYKQDKLSSHEFNLIKQHSIIGYNCLYVKYLRDFLNKIDLSGVCD